MSHILIVEDEAAIAELIAVNLRHGGHEVTIAPDAAQAQVEVDAQLPDLVLLDWMLPGGRSGLQLARAWRGAERTRQLPIIMLTARAAEEDKLSGLDAADDYITKPFSTKELLARVRTVLRRRAPQTLDEPVSVAGLVLDPAARRVTCRRRRGARGADRIQAAALPDDAPRARALARATARPRLGRPRLHRRAHGRRAHQAPA